MPLGLIAVFGFLIRSGSYRVIGTTPVLSPLSLICLTAIAASIILGTLNSRFASLYLVVMGTSFALYFVGAL